MHVCINFIPNSQFLQVSKIYRIQVLCIFILRQGSCQTVSAFQASPFAAISDAKRSIQFCSIIYRAARPLDHILNRLWGQFPMLLDCKHTLVCNRSPETACWGMVHHIPTKALGQMALWERAKSSETWLICFVILPLFTVLGSVATVYCCVKLTYALKCRLRQRTHLTLLMGWVITNITFCDWNEGGEVIFVRLWYHKL